MPPLHTQNINYEINKIFLTYTSHWGLLPYTIIDENCILDETNISIVKFSFKP